MRISTVLGAVLVALFAAAFAYADEPVGESSVSNPHFHLLTFRCESDGDDGAQTTPQSPPLDVDDPGTPGCNAWEINIVANGDLTTTENNWELPLLDLNYGVGDNLQLKYEVPFVRQQADGTSNSALGESLVGVKYRFFDDERSNTEIALYPQVSILAATSNAVDRGLVTPGTVTTIPVLYATQLGRTAGGPVNLTANLGYNFSSKADTTNFVSASVGVGAPLMRKLGVMAELATQQALTYDDTGARQQLLKADLGVMQTVNKKFLLFGAVGHSLSASDQMDHNYLVAGFQLLAGGSNAGL